MSQLKLRPTKLIHFSKYPSSQSLAKIGDEVCGIFEADGDADGAGLDAGAFEFRLGHIVVRGVDGEDDEGFDAAEAGGEIEETDAVAEAARGGDASLEIEREHGAEPGHLALRQFVIGMRRQARVMDAGDLGMFFQEFRDGHGGGALAFNADAESLDAADEEIRAGRIHAAAEVDDVFADALDPVRGAGDSSGEKVGMAAEIFRGAVDGHIEAKSDGLLEHGAGERVVHDGDEIEMAREVYGTLQIHEAKRGIRRRLDVENACLRGDEIFDASEIGFDVADANRSEEHTSEL